jgi:hypothetical protein
VVNGVIETFIGKTLLHFIPTIARAAHAIMPLESSVLENEQIPKLPEQVKALAVGPGV